MNGKRAPMSDATGARTPRIAVVGAGIAGLTAAFRLRQAGLDVTVLERSQHVGGRMRTEEVDGYRVDVGAALLPDFYHGMRRLMRDAGLEGETVPSGGTYGFLRDGRVHRIGRKARTDLLTTRLLSVGSKLRLLRLAADARRMGDRVNFHDLSRAHEADEACTSYAARRLNQEIFDYLIEPLSANYCFAPPEDLSMAHIMLAVRNAVGTGYFNSESGVSFLPRGLARQLDVRCGTDVTSVVEDSDGVRLTCRRRDGQTWEEKVTACVIAVPGPVVPHIWRGLPSALHTYLSELDYATCVHVSFGLASRPAETATWICVPRREYPGGLGVSLDHHRAPGRVPDGKGMISLYWSTQQSEALFGLPDEQITAAALRAIEELGLFPGLAEEIEMSTVLRCRPCVPLHRPGRLPVLRRGLASLSPASRVALAGDYFSLGSTNSALVSGEAAAACIRRRLDPGFR